MVFFQAELDHELKGERTMGHVEIAEQLSSQPVPVERATLPPAPAPIQGPPASFIFALGQVEPRFASLAVEKEVAQAVARVDTVGQTDRQALRTVLADRANRYLARQMCWVFTVEGLETYILVPRDPADFELLIEAVRSNPSSADIDVVIGVQGPLASPETCNGLTLPIVFFDQLYSFDRDGLIREIPRPEDSPEDQFQATSAELLDRIMHMSDNAGAIDEHRAVNYLVVRYPAIYARTVEAHGAESALTGVEARPSRLGYTRKIVDVVFAYTHRHTDVTDKYLARVDVTEEFPFLVTKLAPYYERP
jgi:hypothetical protein